MIDGIDNGALGDEIVDRLRIDPIADGEQQKDEKERFGKPQQSAQNAVDIAEHRNFIDERGADLSQKPAPDLDDEEEQHKGNDETQPICDRLSYAVCNGSRHAEGAFQRIFEGIAEGHGDKDGKNRARKLANAPDKARPAPEQDPENEDDEKYDVEDPGGGSK